MCACRVVTRSKARRMDEVYALHFTPEHVFNRSMAFEATIYKSAMDYVYR